MNAGYVRLSRDDDKRNYVSIENQKLIINQYAADHGVVTVSYTHLPPKLLPLYLCLCKFAIFYRIVFLIFIVRE